MYVLDHRKSNSLSFLWNPPWCSCEVYFR